MNALTLFDRDAVIATAIATAIVATANATLANDVFISMNSGLIDNLPNL